MNTLREGSILRPGGRFLKIFPLALDRQFCCVLPLASTAVEASSAFGKPPVDAEPAGEAIDVATDSRGNMLITANGAPVLIDPVGGLAGSFVRSLSLTADSGDNTITVDVSGTQVGVRFGTMVIDGGDGNDVITVTPSPSGLDAQTVLGGAGEDEIRLLGTNSILVDGGLDSDLLIGTSSDDTLIGGGGDDELHGLADNDSLIGSDGNDTINGGSGNDIIDAAQGTEDSTLLGGDGDNSLLGGTASNLERLEGGNGNDVLNSNGGDGIATSLGGEGDGTYVFEDIDEFFRVDERPNDRTKEMKTRLISVGCQRAAASRSICPPRLCWAS